MFVGISRLLISEVNWRINHMRDAELSTLGDNPIEKTKLNGSETWLHDKLWDGRAHLIPTLPEYWFTKPDNMTVYVKLNWDSARRPDGRISDYDMRLDIRPDRSGATKFPPHLRGGYPDVYIGFTPDEQLPAELQTYLEFSNRKKEIYERWLKVTHQVETFLNSCKSLNEALKLWPDVRMYIPTSYLERVERKVEKAKSASQAADALAQIDVDELQAAAVIARMSGANV